MSIQVVDRTVVRVTKFSGLMKRGANWKRQVPSMQMGSVPALPGGVRASVLRRRDGKLTVLATVRA